ncbi:MAG: hypothetical protein KF856_05365 [Cyclobacteriaceae bacterium]|nr:hypothetical protein [Cyclobacteriaceae bacterium]
MFKRFVSISQHKKGRFNIDGEWFQFGRKQGINFAEKEKLVAPEISLGGNFSYDEKGEFYSTTTIYGYIKKQGVTDSYKVLMAILNSQLCWWYLVNTGTVLSNGYFRYKPNYIKPFPIPIIPPATTEILDELVTQIIESKRTNNNIRIIELENRINQTVYNLYQLSETEIEEINLINH